MPEPTRWSEPFWLRPYPDMLLDGIPEEAPGPEARYERRYSCCTLDGDHSSAITWFADCSVFPGFGLPRMLRQVRAPASR